MPIHSEMLRGRDVFAPSADIRVPAYQRGFAWTEKEVGELTRDLVEAFTQSVIFFLGTMVLVQPKARGPGDVVDGQQRLTTLTIILAVLRDLTTSQDVAYTAHTMIGHEAPAIVGDRQKWRLTLNSMDSDFFRKYVQTKGGTKDIDAIKDAAEESGSESQKRIAMAVQAIHDELDQISPEEQQRFVNWLANDLHVSKVRVTEHNIAYKVYLVLNRRGLPLSDHDILKSALLERAGFPPKEAVKHSERWNSFANRLGHDAFEAMLKQIRFIYDRQMKGEFLDAILLSILPIMTIATFINEKLPRFVDAFDAVVNGATEAIKTSAETRKRLIFLCGIHHEGWRAPAMKYLVDHARSEEETDRFFTKLERLAYMLQYGGRARDFRQRRYRKLLDAMEQPGWMDDPQSPLELSPTEISDFKDRLRGRFPNFKQRRALLMRINAAVPNGRTLPLDADATVEHILPRNPPRESDWYNEWDKKRDRDELIECIGNFTLLTDAENQTADRKSFAEKKEIIFDREGKPTYEMSADLWDLSDWTPAEARARRERLVDIMIREWNL